jgi:hypothetical protein
MSDNIVSKSFEMTTAKPDDARYLVCDWHYSHSMSSLDRYCYVMLSDGEVVAAAIFGVPKARWREQAFLELTRLIRKPEFTCQLTELLAFACKNLKKCNEHLVISYADKTQNHHGGIYQAAGWTYHGERSPLVDGFFIDGEYIPTRSCYDRWGTCSRIQLQRKLPGHKIVSHLDNGKHLYWRALTRFGARKAKKLGLGSKPYPKPTAVRHSDARPSRPCERGATPRDRSTSIDVVPSFEGADVIHYAADEIEALTSAKTPPRDKKTRG